MAVTFNALDLMDEQLQKAAAPKTSGKPIFLFLKPDEKFLIRPLFDLKDSVVLMKHNLWSEDPAKRVNAICAQEENNACLYCQQASENKKLTAKIHFYLPVFVYKGINQKTQKEITYEETQEDGSKVTRAIQGIRLLELAAFGTVGDILKWFREFVRDSENCKITECDFSLSQSGEGTSKSFVLMSKAQRPMADQIAKIASTINMDNVKARVLEARAPYIVTDSHPARGKSTENIHNVVKDINNGYRGDDMVDRVNSAIDPLDDTIQDGW